MIFALALACSSPAPTSPPAPVAAPPAPVAPAPVLAPAPSLDAYGLTVGASTEADIRAWLTERKLTCVEQPSVRRTTFRYACEGALPSDVVPGASRGLLSNLLVVRGDTTPMSHFSTVRKYSLPADAVADYADVLAALSTRLGAPTRGAATPKADQLDGTAAHWATSWSFANLAVRLVLLKAGSATITLSETWDLPGAEDHEETRTPTGANPHAPAGANPHAPTGANPHAPAGANPHAPHP